jgi:hypothetical protein
MQQSFNPNVFHTVSANFGATIATKITDPRMPDCVFLRDLSLNDYNKTVEFLKENDHRFAINMLNSMFN